MILDALHYDAFAQFDILYINTLNFIYKIFRSISILTRYLGPSNTNFDLISKYPLITVLIALIILGVLNYLFVKKKYKTTD